MAMNKVLENRDQFVKAFRENMIAVMENGISDDMDTAQYDAAIERLKDRMLKLIQENVSQRKEMSMYEAEYKKIAKRMKELQLKKTADHVGTNNQARNGEELEKYIAKAACTIKEYDDVMVRKLIQRINVINADKIEIIFKARIVVEQKMDI